MGFDRLRRYDVQARWAAILALLSILPLTVAAVLAWRRYDVDLRQIIYGAHGRFLPVFFGCVAVSMVPGALGFLLGWASAGQRRNDKPVRSWVGFFVGGGVLTFDVILVIAFYLLRLKHPG